MLGCEFSLSLLGHSIPILLVSDWYLLCKCVVLAKLGREIFSWYCPLGCLIRSGGAGKEGTQVVEGAGGEVTGCEGWEWFRLMFTEWFVGVGG